MGSSPRLLFNLLVIFSVLGQSVFAATCKSTCPTPNKSSVYKYEAGKVYTYDIESVTSVFVPGNKNQETTLKLSGVFDLFVGDDCKYVLKIKNLMIFGPDNKKFPITEDFLKPVQFLMSNDELVPEICADETDTEFSMNIKRAIISLFQQTEGKKYETDVFGICPTTYTKNVVDGVTFVKKARQLNSCRHREMMSNGFMTGVVNEYAGLKSTPFLRGDYKMEKRITDKGVINNVYLTEEYEYAPYTDKHANSMAMKVVTKFTYKNMKPAAKFPVWPKQKVETILFENPGPYVSDKTGAALKEKLKETLVEYSPSIGHKAAGHYSELIRLMRHAKKDQILNTFSQIKSKTIHNDVELTRRVYLDALFRAGTGDTVEAIAQLMKTGLSDKEKTYAYLSLNWVRSMTKSAFTSAVKFLDGPSYSYMYVGTLIYKYCHAHGCSATELKPLTDKYLAKLANCKITTKTEEDGYVYVLKGIKNAQFLYEPLLEKVVTCTTSKATTRVRVAALEALESGFCDKKITNAALSILGNVNEDSELRIKAFLLLVKCPSSKIATEIKTLLDSEKIYQVGSFITSYLASLRASTDPTREAERLHFGQIRTTSKFPSDFRRYSFNRELSYSMESLGLGASSDMSVIYSQKSFLPRSFGTNFTMEAFGTGYNFLEFNARQENLDHIFEHYFGPKGVFGKYDIQGFYDFLVENWTKFSDKAKARFRRSIKEDYANFVKSVSMDSDAVRDVNLDLSLKFFGNEMFFYSLTEDILPYTGEQMMDKFFEWLDSGIEKAKDFSHVYENQMFFLDHDFVYPTGIGFPLKLKTEGTSATKFETSGQIDLKTILKDPKNAKFKFTVAPSHNLEFTGSLLVDGYAVETGIELVGTTHTSTSMDVDFALLEGGKGFDLKLGSPQKKQELFSFEHKFHLITREQGQETVALALKSTEVKPFEDCFDQLNPLIGLTMCVSTSMSKPTAMAYPFVGTHKFSLWFEVEPQYYFKAMLDNNKPRNPSFLFSFSTPKSDMERLISFKGEAFIDQDAYIKLDLVTPIQVVDFEFGLKNNDKEVALYALANNDQKKFLAKFGFTKEGTEYKPIFIVESPYMSGPYKSPYKMDGKITVDSEGELTKYNFNDVSISGDGFTPVIVNGWISRKGINLDADFSVAKDSYKGQYKGKFEYQPEFLTVESAFITDIAAPMNFDFVYHMKYPENKFVSDFKMSQGKGKELIQFTKYWDFDYAEKKLVSSIWKHDLKVEGYAIEFKFNGEHKDLNCDFDAFFGYDKFKSFMKLKNKAKPAGDYDLNVSGGLNKHNFKWASKHIIQGKKSTIDNKLTISTGTIVEFRGTFAHKMSFQDADIKFEGSLVPVEKKEPYKFNFVYYMTPRNGKSNAKFLLGEVLYASYDGKFERGDKLNGQFTMMFKDILDGNFEFKSLKGNGDAFALINFLKFDRKVKVDSKFNVHGYVCEILTDFYYDFEKDDTKKVHFETKSNFDKTNMYSKNVFEVFTEKYMFNLEGKQTGSWKEGTMNYKYDFTLPTGRYIYGDFDRSVNLNKDRKSDGHLITKLADRLPSKKERSLYMEGKFTDAEFKYYLFNMLTKFVYTDFETKTFEADVNVKHLPKDGHFIGAFYTKLFGSLIPQAVEMNVDVEEYSETHAIYKLTSKYGADFDFTVDGKYDIGSILKPQTHEIKANMNLPKTTYKKFFFESYGSFLVPENIEEPYDVTYKGTFGAGEKIVTIATAAKGNYAHGTGDFSLDLPSYDPLTAKYNYVYDSKDALKWTTKGGLKLGFTNGKFVDFTGDFALDTVDNIVFHLIMNSDYENLKPIDVTFKHHKADDFTYTTNTKMTADGQIYGFNTVFIFSEVHPSVDVDILYAGKDMKLYGGFSKLSDYSYKSEIKIINWFDFYFVGNMEFGLESVEKLYFKSEIDSPKLKFDKVFFEIAAKEGSNGRGVTFTATSAGKNILSGTADFSEKNEQGTTVYEGEGNVKWYDEAKAAKFKFIRNSFYTDKDNENGYGFVFNGQVGLAHLVSEFKFTNKNFVILSTICEQKKQCNKISMQSVLKKADYEGFDHVLEIEVDLRQLGYSHEFGLKAGTARTGYFIDHSMEIHFQAQDKPKYQYTSYIRKDGAGVSLELPTRTIAFEAVYKLPTEFFGYTDTTLSFYLDKKNAPENKAMIGFVGELKRPSKRSVNIDYEFKFVHPTVKPLVIKSSAYMNGDSYKAGGKVVVDIFKKADQKIVFVAKYENTDQSGKGFNITSDVQLKSPGLGLDLGFNGHTGLSLDNRKMSASAFVLWPVKGYEFGSYFYMTPYDLEFFVRRFKDQIIYVVGHYDVAEHKSMLKSTFDFVGKTPVVFDTSMEGFKSAKFEIVKGDLFKINGEYMMNKWLSLYAVGYGKELFNGKVVLDGEHFLKSEYKVDDVEIRTFLDKLKEDTHNGYKVTQDELKEKFETLKIESKELYEKMRDALPDMSAFVSDFKTQINKLEEDLMKDPSIKEFIEYMSRWWMNVVAYFNKFVTIYREYFDNLIKIVREYMDYFMETYKTQVLPQLEELYLAVETFIYKMYGETVELVIALFERVAKALKTWEVDFNKIRETLVEVFKNFREMYETYYETIVKEYTEFYKLIVEYFESLPGFEMLKEKFNEWKKQIIFPEYSLSVVLELIHMVRDGVQIKEVQDFLDILYKYVEAKSAHQTVDDMEYFRRLCDAYWIATKALYGYVYNLYGELTGTPVEYFKDWKPYDTFKMFPYYFTTYFSTFKFSPWNYFLNEKMPTFKEMFQTFLQYRPYAWSPKEFVPPFEMHAEIADGSHYFTFDGKHYSFPGSCKYVMVGDYVDKNFTFIANVLEGKMESVILMDKTDRVELKKDGSLYLNDKPTEFPLHYKNTMHAWREYYTVSLLTSYGASIECSTDLRVCHVTVSGFYLGKIRGLLGNGNAEPYDDFTLPKGVITEDYTEFANAYKVGECADVPAHDHAVHAKTTNEFCNKFFSVASPMKHCFYFKDPAQYRDQCEHAVFDATDKMDAACNIAMTYASTCIKDRIFVTVPWECKKCYNNEVPVEVGYDFSVKTPTTFGDVVIVAEFSPENEKVLDEMINTMVPEIRAKYTARGITDVRVSVIGYSKEEKYLNLYTTNGDLNYNGKIGQLKMAGPRVHKPLVTGNEIFDEYFKTLHEWYTKFNAPVAEAFFEAFNYPFRPAATKTVLFVLPYGEIKSNPIRPFYQAIANLAYHTTGMFVNIVTPVKDMTINKDPKKAMDVAAFSNSKVISYKEKKPVLGSFDFNKFSYETDVPLDLVLYYDGYVFPYNNWVQSAQKKQFAGGMANVLAYQAANTVVNSECMCQMLDGLHPKPYCYAESSEFKEPSRKK